MNIYEIIEHYPDEIAELGFNEENLCSMNSYEQLLLHRILKQQRTLNALKREIDKWTPPN